jgi:hypothetical protein
LPIVHPNRVPNERGVRTTGRVRNRESEPSKPRRVRCRDSAAVTDVFRKSFQLAESKRRLRVGQPLFISARPFSTALILRRRARKRISTPEPLEERSRIAMDRWCRENVVDGELDE